MQSFLIISDLHLGIADPLEDFLLWGDSPTGPDLGHRAAAAAALDDHFARFLGEHSRTLPGPATLVLLGDFIDLWQIDIDPFTPAAAVHRALEAHPAVVAALRAWTAAGHHLVHVLGNHDHAACDREAWSILREVFPRLNAHADGAPIWHFADNASGLYATHGHRWDVWNRINRRTPNDECVGRMIDHLLLNTLEPRFPLIDKGDLIHFLRTVREAYLEGHLPTAAKALVQGFRRIERGGWRFCDLLHRALDRHHPLDETSLREEQATRFRSSLRRDLQRRLRARAPELPANPRFVLFGHTHEAVAVDADGLRFVNTGTWRPVLRSGPDGSRQIVQPLDFATVLHDGERWGAELSRAGISPAHRIP